MPAIMMAKKIGCTVITTVGDDSKIEGVKKLGADYVISERYALSATYYQSIRSDNVYELDGAFTVGLTYNF